MQENILVEQKTMIETSLQETEDLQVKEMKLNETEVLVCYLDTMADEEKIMQQLSMYQTGISLEEVTETMTDQAAISQELLIGNTVLLFADKEEYLVLNTIQEHERTPEEPENERIVQGSHIGFIENLSVNIHLLRRRITEETLKVTYVTVGKETNNKLALVYMNDKVDKATLQHIEERLQAIQNQKVYVIGDLINYLLEDVHTVFPKKLYTERPDRAASYLEEGKIAVMMDNSSSACIVPISFFAFFQSPDDYNGQILDGMVFRLLRLACFFGALTFPALYIAVITFHFEIIPFEMITLVKNSIETVPFPPFYEAFIMIATIELIREAGIRLPSPIGQTIGIVGGIIIGEAVVTAGLVSNIVVIVIALTAIMSFTISSYEMGNTLRILSFPIMVAASLFGFVGIVASSLIILFHLCSLQILQAPYFHPLAPFDFASIRATLFRYTPNVTNENKK